MPRLTSADSTLFLIPDSAYEIVDGQPIVNLGALAGGATTTDSVTNLSTLTPNGGTLTAALDGADTRITTAQSSADAAGSTASAAQSTADGAVTDAAAAQSTADGAASAAATAQSTANTANTTANAAQSTANSALSGLAGKQNTLPVGLAGGILVSDGTAYQASTAAALLTNRNVPQLMDCLTDPAVSGWGRVLSGTGQVASVTATTSSHPGQWSMSHGPGTASRAGFYLGPGTGGLITPSVSTVGFFEVMIQTPTVTAVGQTFDQYIGFCDEAASAATFSGVYFYVDTLNNIRARRNVSGVLSNDLNITPMVAGTWYRFRAEFSAGSVVLSYAATSSRTASLTTALTAPIVAAPQSPQVKTIRQTGATTRSTIIDYLSWYLPQV